jgi:molybdenum cofactor cytidylyltransferase
MPRVSADTLRTVATALDDHPVAYAQHLGRRGHPVGFSAELFSELLSLTGDEGARRLLARYPAVGVEVDDPGALMDIDTLADLHAARSA